MSCEVLRKEGKVKAKVSVWRYSSALNEVSGHLDAPAALPQVPPGCEAGRAAPLPGIEPLVTTLAEMGRAEPVNIPMLKQFQVISKAISIKQ
jgi:hypothetical protein